jgi:hypothetical protein
MLPLPIDLREFVAPSSSTASKAKAIASNALHAHQHGHA